MVRRGRGGRGEVDTPSTEILHAILRAAPGALVAVDGDGTIVFVNDAATDLFGWRDDELVGRPVERLVPPRLTTEHAELRANFQGHPRARPMAGAPGFPVRRRDGSEIHAEIGLTPVALADGTEQLVVVAVRPIGDELAAEARRQASLSQREQQARLESLGQLAGGIAHEFNNLLGVILNYTSLLDSQLSDPTASSDLAEIRKAGERAAELTRQLLSFARRESSNPEPVDVGALAREVAPALEQCLGDTVDLVLELDDAPLVASADHRQLEQVLLLLAVNAREAMPIGGLLRLGVHAEPDPGGSGAGTIAIEVADTGVGMAPDVVTRAFEPFFTTKADSDGHGLGLATVHGTIRRHGGRVSLRSTIGAGTTVRIELPATAPRAAQAGDRGAERAGMGRILLAEDEDALRSATDRLLTAEGYEVLAARDGIEAIEIFEREGGAVDLLLSDVVMPRMRGDELARRLVERAPSLPVVLVSGHDFGEAALLGRLLDKPVSTPDLLRTIREVLDG